ncbi:MAG: hypothetical protein LBU40_03905 [Methanobrevibacter sp.]|jgi:hypothetical protein|nr:hypothetical protein [Methanobrevibacter sp.]
MIIRTFTETKIDNDEGLTAYDVLIEQLLNIYSYLTLNKLISGGVQLFYDMVLQEVMVLLDIQKKIDIKREEDFPSGSVKGTPQVKGEKEAIDERESRMIN